MKNIEIALLDRGTLITAEKAMVTAAKLTQHSHKIKNLDDFMELYKSGYSADLVQRLIDLPHPTLQKLGIVNLVIVGLSRRALAQITRHQNEIKFIAGSIQYSDHSDSVAYVLPPGVEDVKEDFIKAYEAAGEKYKELIAKGIDKDLAGYALPQGFRTSLIISATPYQIKHMINQRTCRRNTEEVRYIFLKIWKLLAEFAPAWFEKAGPFCMRGPCQEGRMCCGQPMTETIDELIEEIEQCK